MSEVQNLFQSDEELEAVDDDERTRAEIIGEEGAVEEEEEDIEGFGIVLPEFMDFGTDDPAHPQPVLGEGDFETPLTPDDIRALLVQETSGLDALLVTATLKYPFFRPECMAPGENVIRADMDNVRRIIFCTYLAVADPTLSKLTAAANPDFHYWLSRYYRAFLYTLQPYGLDAFMFALNVLTCVNAYVYLT
jgi:hypothetical protein